MDELNENLALSILFANTRRKKREKDLVSIAKSFDYLKRLYGSSEIIAQKIGISKEMVRKFLLPLEFPDEIQQLIQMRYIDSIDIINELSTIKDKEIQLSICKGSKKITSKDVRDIKRLLRNSNLSVDEAKKLILNQKERKIHFFLIDFNDTQYQFIMKRAKEQNIDPAIFVKNVFVNTIKNNFGEE